MVTFLVALLGLILGYAIYGRFVERVFGPDDRETPAVYHEDGVDYVPMPTWRVYLVQMLNVVGLGPIFGGIAGALFGPIVYLWIVFGCIFGGAVHDYMVGMISSRHDGASVGEIVGDYLGENMRTVMRIFSIVLLILTGTVFTSGPAALLAILTPKSLSATFWLIIILLYYFAATLLPIDKIIGKIYPIFGIALLFMAFGVAGGIMLGHINGVYHMPELTLANLHPKNLPVWPMLFITVACGAISGFHATQSPMMARCMKNEKEGRKIFYRAMITEGVIALIWAAAGASFYPSLQALADAGAATNVVYEISKTLLGPVGMVLAMLGVIVCPITSGDTAFRSVRLSIADWFKMDQKDNKKRLLLTIPILLIAALLTQIDFTIIWRYFSWANQTLAMMALWMIAAYLLKNKKNFYIALIPAIFMSFVSMTYILIAPEGFKLNYNIGVIIGSVLALMIVLSFYKFIYLPEKKKNN